MPAEFSVRQQPVVQMPTPKPSAFSTPSSMAPDVSADTDKTMISVSTAFHPGAHGVNPDTIFASSDYVLFYVSSEVLKGVSPNAFRRVFEVNRTRRDPSKPTDSNSPQGIISVPETSGVLNVILHIIYGTSAAQHSPSFETLLTAVDRMPYYDLNPKDFIFPRAPLYELLLTYAPLFPLPLYTLAGHHGLHDMAVATSSHLLSYSLANLQEDVAERMGALYLKKLMCLHMDRFNALKQILLQPPHPHPATRECSFNDQKRLTRAWALVAAYLAWDARPDLSTYSMRSAFLPLTEDITCEQCKDGLEKRIKDVVNQWASVRVSLFLSHLFSWKLRYGSLIISLSKQNSAPFKNLAF